MRTYPSGAPMKLRAPTRKRTTYTHAMRMIDWPDWGEDNSDLWRDKPYAERMQRLSSVARHIYRSL